MRCYYRSPCAILELTFSRANTLEQINYLSDIPDDISEVSGFWQRQLMAYFSGSLKDFAYPPSKSGTSFQCRVWQEIAKIPYGQTMCYGDLAKRLGSSARAVGGACGANPLPIIIPCHRVVAKNQLGGFSFGPKNQQQYIKRWLLQHEGALD